MTNVICDRCGKSVNTNLISRAIKENLNMGIVISCNGRRWDLCGDCERSFMAWAENKQDRKDEEDADE